MTTYINPGNNTGLYGINDININTPYGNANVESFLATGSDTGGNVVGNIVASGNITATYYFGDGSNLTGVGSTYGNANVVALLGAFGSNTVVTTGNITGGNFVGSGAALTSITGANVTGTVPLATSATTAGTANTVAGANVTGTVANATYATSAGSATTATTATSATTAGTVTTAAQPNITSVGTLTSLAVTGNISGNYYIGNGSLLTGITGSGTYSNSNVTSLMASFGSNTISTTGNITAGYFLGDGSQLTNISVAAGSKIENGGSNVNIATSGGNIDFSVPTLGTVMKVLAGNGAVTMTQELVVDGDIRAISNGVVSAQGNVTGGNLVTGGVVTATGAITGGSLVSGTTISAVGNITGGNIAGAANVEAVNGNFTNVYTGGLTSLGTVDVGGELDVAGNITAPLSLISGGNISASGTGVGFITATANISAGGNIISTGYITAGGNITSTGNIAASYFVGNGSLLTGITTTYGNANVAAFLPTYTGDLAGDDLFLNVSTGNAYIQAREILSSTQTITGGLTVGSNSGDLISTVGSVVGNVIQGNSAINSSGIISAVGNITGGNLNTAGNVTGTYILGNGSLLTGIPGTAAGGSPTQVQYARSDNTFGGAAPMTFNDSNGNIALGNVIFNPGNSASQINNIQAMDTSTGSNPGRILIGNGYNGSISNDYDFLPRTRAARVAVWGSHTQGSETVQASGLVAQESVTLTANTNANLNSRSFAMSGILQLGGGVSAYNFQQPYTITLAAQGGLSVAGTSGNSAVGNTVVTALGGTVSGVQAQSGATITNGVGFTGIGVTAGGTITNYAAFAPFTSHAAGTVPTNFSILYNPPSGGGGGVLNSNNWRAASNYWFLNNEDAAAQNKLGSLRSYTEFNGVSATTSGALTISKLNGQVQQVNLTGAVTSISFSDFVTSASDGTNTDEQCDTVTVIFNQGATGGYGVTFPAASSTIKYAGGVSTLPSTAANSLTLVSISAIRISSTTTYLITISPGFV